MVTSELLKTPEVFNPKKVICVSPGQGSQYKGMGENLYRESLAARRIFDEADDALGMKLSEMMFYGEEEELNKTFNAQPAILTHGVAVMSTLEEKTGIKPSSFLCLAGHSVGEYVSLVVSGAIKFGKAVPAVRGRGKAMWNIGEKTDGYMAAILGQELSFLKEICDQATVEIANDNCPGQVVLSGSRENMDKARELLLKKGVNEKRIITLKVSGAFHSSLMKPAAKDMEEILKEIQFQDPQIPIASNVTTELISKAVEIPNELIEQIYRPVRWRELIERNINNDTLFLETGPGQILTGLVKRINKNVKTVNLGTPEDIDNFARAIS